MINKISLNTFNKNNVSFGLNDTNIRAFETLYANNQDRFVREAAIKSIDMEDEDINPILCEFSSILGSQDSSTTDLNAVLDKISEYKGGLQNLKEGFSNLMAHWPVLFLSVRAKASEIMDKHGMIHPQTGGLSRTTCNPLFREKAIRNIEDANKYTTLVTRQGKCPNKQFLISLHKILTKELSYIDHEGKAYSSPEYSGIIRGSEEDNVSKNLQNQDVEKRLDDFFKWLERNYDKNETFTLTAQSYKKLLGIVPFYDANGRSIRGFIDALLLSKGYKFVTYPNNYAEVRNLKTEVLAKLIEDNCEPV